MKKSKAPSSRRAEIQQLYQCYASGQVTLPARALLRFLHKEQMELTANEETAESLIDRYEIEETARERRCMTFEGFLRYMESKDCCVFNQVHTSVYQDMDQPLTSYFISTSHNTYLTGDQLVGKSHLDAYVCALRKGCRCLEIDCWDGPDMEPVVYHGYTLTTKILFKDVITTVEQHAFEVSAYPVILSLENHCSQEQQEVMAQYLISILGDKLLRTPLDHATTGDLPSPNDLKYKILIKNKKLRPQIKAEDAAGAEESGDEDEEEEEEEDEEDEDHQTKAKFWSPRKAGSRKKARILFNTTRSSSPGFIQQDQGHPHPTTTLKSFGMLARSLDNGGCGYVLKPAVLMSSQRSFDPSCSQHNVKPTHLLLKVISGSNLPIPRSGKALDPFVRVEIHGIASDSRRKTTHTVKNNSLSPHWDSDMNFNISIPELCLIRFCVRDQTGLLSSDFVGQYMLSFGSLKKGEPQRQREQQGVGLHPATAGCLSGLETDAAWIQPPSSSLSGIPKYRSPYQTLTHTQPRQQIEKCG
ncbi:hypothetical protein PAMP_019926 [Pampus punctatissimus]